MISNCIIKKYETDIPSISKPIPIKKVNQKEPDQFLDICNYLKKI